MQLVQNVKLDQASTNVLFVRTLDIYILPETVLIAADFGTLATPHMYVRYEIRPALIEIQQTTFTTVTPVLKQLATQSAWAHTITITGIFITATHVIGCAKHALPKPITRNVLRAQQDTYLLLELQIHATTLDQMVSIPPTQLLPAAIVPRDEKYVTSQNV